MTAAAQARARSAPAAAVRAVPAWAWLAGLVVVSVLVRYAFARRIVAPWIVVDEIVYAELAKSFAASGRFELREVPAGGALGVVYPVLISPAYALFESVLQAYAAIKAINAVLFSLAALPAYALARTVSGPALSLAVAALALAVPSGLYAGMVMTENAFYPAFLLAALALVRVLEAPTWRRSLLLAAAVALAFLTRAQAVALVPAATLAPLLLVAVRGTWLRGLAAFRPLYGTLAGAGAAVLAAQLARGRGPGDLLGAYSVTLDSDYRPAEVLRWLLWHVAELDLYVAVVPFAALLLVAMLAPRLEPAEQAFTAAAVALGGCLLVQVAAFASVHAHRVEERNLFYLAPLFFAALALWIERGLPRPPLPAAGAALVAAVLPPFLPFERLLNVSAQSDTLMLLAWWPVQDAVSDPLWQVVGAVTLSAVLLAAIAPRGVPLLLPAALLAAYAVAVWPIEAGVHGVRRASIGGLFQGIADQPRDWVDRASGGDREVVVLWPGPEVDRMVVHQNEFFSRSVGRVFTLGEPLPGGLPATQLVFDPVDGLLRDASRRPVVAPYALVPESMPVAGRRVAADRRRGVALLRLQGPLRIAYTLAGIWPDGWTGPAATYTRYACRGGTLVATAESDASLFRRPQTLRARVGGRAVARVRIPRAGTVRIRVPLRRLAGDRCVVRFEVSPTAVPGAGDERRLGTHLRSFRYLPPP